MSQSYVADDGNQGFVSSSSNLSTDSSVQAEEFIKITDVQNNSWHLSLVNGLIRLEDLLLLFSGAKRVVLCCDYDFPKLIAPKNGIFNPPTGGWKGYDVYVLCHNETAKDLPINSKHFFPNLNQKLQDLDVATKSNVSLSLQKTIPQKTSSLNNTEAAILVSNTDSTPLLTRNGYFELPEFYPPKFEGLGSPLLRKRHFYSQETDDNLKTPFSFADLKTYFDSSISKGFVNNNGVKSYPLMKKPRRELDWPDEKHHKMEDRQKTNGEGQKFQSFFSTSWKTTKLPENSIEYFGPQQGDYKKTSDETFGGYSGSPSNVSDKNSTKFVEYFEKLTKNSGETSESSTNIFTKNLKDCPDLKPINHDEKRENYGKNCFDCYETVNNAVKCDNPSEIEIFEHFGVNSTKELFNLDYFTFPLVDKDDLYKRFLNFRAYFFRYLRRTILMIPTERFQRKFLWRLRGRYTSKDSVDRYLPGCRKKCNLCNDEDFTLYHLFSKNHICLYQWKHDLDPPHILEICYQVINELEKEQKRNQ